ncbi:MAG: hypothetical protein A2W29_06905 [Gemmatimonadetes bacterium RBG_16_66_8]|nr:MAG: hypothetical protein A2W29_06905 [Gemmatimonadetes bacterium RBG_16_66_8]
MPAPPPEAAMRPAASAVFVLLIAGCGRGGGLPFYEDASLTPRWRGVVSTRATPVHRIAEFALLDQTGRPFTAGSLDGRVHVANFFFTSCGDVCPITRRLLSRVAAAFAAEDNLLITSYSVTPGRDSVADLAAYAAYNHIDHRRWKLLTGDLATVRQLGASYLVGFGRAGDYGVASLAHTEMLVLVDQHRRIRGVYNGTLALDIDQLIADARTLLTDGSFTTEGQWAHEP